MIKLCGLWKRQGRNGGFLAGKLGDTSILVFENKKKRSADQPDYEVVLNDDSQKPQVQASSPQPQKPRIIPKPQNHAPQSAPPAFPPDFQSEPWPTEQDHPPEFGF